MPSALLLPGLDGTATLLVGHDAPQALVDDVRTAVASVPAATLAGRVAAVLTTDVTRAFAASGVPALYVRGTRDRLVREASVRHMAAVRKLTVARVPAPHLVLQTQPAAAWDAIVRFLATI